MYDQISFDVGFIREQVGYVSQRSLVRSCEIGRVGYCSDKYTVTFEQVTQEVCRLYVCVC